MADYANLAMSLRDNEAFQAALTRIWEGARDDLCRLDADDKNAILKAQATVKVVDDIRDNLEAFIRQGVVRTPAGIA